MQGEADAKATQRPAELDESQPQISLFTFKAHVCGALLFQRGLEFVNALVHHAEHLHFGFVEEFCLQGFDFVTCLRQFLFKAFGFLDRIGQRFAVVPMKRIFKACYFCIFFRKDFIDFRLFIELAVCGAFFGSL